MSMYNLLEYSKNNRQSMELLGMNFMIFMLIIIMQISLQILHHLNTKAVLQEKHEIQIKKNSKNTEQPNTKTNKNLEIVVSLKHISNFWRHLGMPLINCEVSLTLTWSENRVLTDITTQAAVAARGNNPVRPEISAPTNATFQITDAKFNVPVITLSTQDNNKATIKNRI